MAKHARSARGKIVDFDLIAIKQQLARQPVPVSVNQRRKFIDEKDGIKHRDISPPPTPDQVPAALQVAAQAAEQSAKAATTKKHDHRPDHKPHKKAE